MATKTKATENGKLVNRIAEVETPSVMKPEIVVFRIIGISPLLQNNPANFIGKTEADTLGTKKVYVDEEEAKLRLYLDADGNHCHPTEAFPKGMVRAAAGKKFGKMHATKVLKGGVFITEPFSILIDEDGEPLTTYTIDRRSVVVGKSRVLRCRPCWMPWSVLVALEIDTAMVSPKNVLECLNLAGRIIGCGDNRPEKGGGNGRYRAELK